MGQSKLIGIEEHYLTPGIRDAWTEVRLAASGPSVSVHSGAIERRLLDLAGERLALMDETGLDVQVLSLTTPALHDLKEAEVDLARRANDAVATAITRHPDRFQALAALPVGDPQAAALELERCVQTKRRPASVSRYSTIGGTVLKTCRLRSPLASMSRTVWVSISGFPHVLRHAVDGRHCPY